MKEESKRRQRLRVVVEMLHATSLHDFDKADRIKGLAIDLGAYEYQDAPTIVPDLNGRVYVKIDAACIVADHDGSSWDKAYPYLADVLFTTTGAGSGIAEIWVATGMHTPRHIRVSAGSFEHRNRTF